MVAARKPAHPARACPNPRHRRSRRETPRLALPTRPLPRLDQTRPAQPHRSRRRRLATRQRQPHQPARGPAPRATHPGRSRRRGTRDRVHRRGRHRMDHRHRLAAAATTHQPGDPRQPVPRCVAARVHPRRTLGPTRPDRRRRIPLPHRRGLPTPPELERPPVRQDPHRSLGRPPTPQGTGALGVGAVRASELDVGEHSDVQSLLPDPAVSADQGGQLGARSAQALSREDGPQRSGCGHFLPRPCSSLASIPLAPGTSSPSTRARSRAKVLAGLDLAGA
jgi:hypothetical protein